MVAIHGFQFGLYHVVSRFTFYVAASLYCYYYFFLFGVQSFTNSTSGSSSFVCGTLPYLFLKLASLGNCDWCISKMRKK